MNRQPLLSSSQLGFGYTPQTPLFEDLSFTVEPGTLMSVLGPNGIGKSTLLSCLTGQRQPGKGSVQCVGKPLLNMSVPQIARHIAVVPQAHELSFALTVQQIVLLGRAAHIGLFRKPDDADYAIARAVMIRIGIGHLAEKSFDQISGGERQLAMIAMALAQQVSLLVLDEPTSHLDLANQGRILELLRELVGDGHGVLMTTHFPEHALMLGGQALLMMPAAECRLGSVQNVVTEVNLGLAYGAPVSLLQDKGVVACAPRFSWLSDQ